jgi:hypothetical protein
MVVHCPSLEKRLCEDKGETILWKVMNNSVQYGPTGFGILARLTPEMMKPVIERYFSSVRTTFQSHALQAGGMTYKVGMYCTAAMCLLGSEKHLAKFFWVSPEGRYDAEYKKFFQNEGRWNLLQQLPTICSRCGRQRLKAGIRF